MARATAAPPTAPPESLAEELARLTRRAEADERALASLRDDLHNASVAVAQASGDQLALALQRKRDLERELDATLASAVGVIERLNVLRPAVAAERRAVLVAKLRQAGARFTAAAQPCEDAFTEAFAALRTLMDAAKAVTETARGCGPDTIRDTTDGLQLADLKSWLLNQLDAAGFDGITPAVMTYDPHQRTSGVTPTEAATGLANCLETTR